MKEKELRELLGNFIGYAGCCMDDRCVGFEEIEEIEGDVAELKNLIEELISKKK